MRGPGELFFFAHNKSTPPQKAGRHCRRAAAPPRFSAAPRRRSSEECSSDEFPACLRRAALLSGLLERAACPRSGTTTGPLASSRRLPGPPGPGRPQAGTGGRRPGRPTGPGMSSSSFPRPPGVDPAGMPPSGSGGSESGRPDGDAPISSTAGAPAAAAAAAPRTRPPAGGDGEDWQGPASAETQGLDGPADLPPGPMSLDPPDVAIDVAGNSPDLSVHRLRAAAASEPEPAAVVAAAGGENDWEEEPAWDAFELLPPEIIARIPRSVLSALRWFWWSAVLGALHRRRAGEILAGAERLRPQERRYAAW